MVQEKVTCNRQPVPIRHPQPLSQGLSALPAPLTQGSQGDGGFTFTGAKPAGGSLRGSQSLRETPASAVPIKKPAKPQAFFYGMFFHGHVPGKNTVTRQIFAKIWRNRPAGRGQTVEKNPAKRFFDSLSAPAKALPCGGASSLFTAR